MQSLWNVDTQIPERQALVEDAQVENIVIGGGMAGILTAYFLKTKGKEVIVLEAGRIASGQTKNTTAKITSQHGMIYEDLLRKVGRKRAQGYAEANETAIQAYEEIIEKEGIWCDFEKLPSFLYSTEASGIEQLKKEAEAAAELGIKAQFIEGDKIREVPFSVTGAVCFAGQAQFHPLKFMQQLSERIKVYENTNVLSVKGHMISTNRGTIKAQNIIFATHYPFINVPGCYFLRQHQDRSYVVALKGEGVPQKLEGMYYSIDKNGLSFRCADGKLLLGGGSHRTGKKECAKYSYLREQINQYYPQAEEVTRWAAQDCMPHDKIPLIGKYSVLRPYWYVATGFQKWGMTSSMIAAMIISDMICGRDNSYRAVFSPQRLLFRAGIKDLCIDIVESAMGLTKGLFGKKKMRCSHMGCHLEWNEEEQSFDCPCHGSRYNKEGKLIDNPAQKL